MPDPRPIAAGALIAALCWWAAEALLVFALRFRRGRRMLALFPLHVGPALLLIAPINTAVPNSDLLITLPLLTAVTLRLGRWLDPLGVWRGLSTLARFAVLRRIGLVMLAAGTIGSAWAMARFWAASALLTLPCLIGMLAVLALAGGVAWRPFAAIATPALALTAVLGVLLRSLGLRYSIDALQIFALAQTQALVVLGAALRGLSETPGLVRRPNTALFLVALGFLASLQAFGRVSASADRPARLQALPYQETLVLDYAPIKCDAQGRLFSALGSPETPLDLPRPDLLRVLLLGGSAAAGRGVDSDLNSAALLRNCLSWVRGQEAEVLNFGTEGYSSTQFALLYTLFLEDLRPNVIVIYAGFNDAFTTGDYSNRPEIKARFRQYSRLVVHSIMTLRGADVRRGMFGRRQQELPLSNRLELARMIKYEIRHWLAFDARRDAGPPSSPDQFETNLELIVSHALRSDVRVLLCLEGSKWSGTTERYAPVMRGLAQRHPESVKYIDGDALLRAADPGLERGLFLDEVHLSAAGHRVLAEAWCDAIEAAGWTGPDHRPGRRAAGD